MQETITIVPPLVRQERWQAPSVDTTTVQRTLERLWAEIAEERRQILGRPRLATDAASMRTRTLNLVVVADTPEQVKQVKSTVLGLTEFFPSRTVVLVREPSPHTPDGLDVSVATEEHSTDRFKATIRFETVVVSTGSGPEQMLASVASPILVPELPTFVWYPSGTFSRSPLLAELLDTTDRLIVDSSTARNPAEALRYLAGLESQSGEGLRLSDMAWTRLTPWRQMIAQFFDLASNVPCLDAIEEVRISYAASDAAGRSGLSAGLLMAGWLCTRLGWRAPGEELVRSREGWKLTLRAGAKGRSREVILTLSETQDEAACPCLGAVTLEANGPHAGTFKVERISDEGIATTSETPVPVSRIVYVRNPDDRKLLSQELREFGGDPMYAETLQFAASLWPEGVET